jgi:hypothetical protein
MTKSKVLITDDRAREGAILTPMELLGLCSNPHEFVLVSIIADVYDTFGRCCLSVEDLGILAMMSTGKASSCLRTLSQKGLIIILPMLSSDALRPGCGSNRCLHCGLEFPSLDKHHILPTSKGGKDNKSNITHLCPNCHRLAHINEYVPYWRASHEQFPF